MQRLSLLVLSLTTLALMAADWPHWRGPSRDGLTTESSGYKDGKWNLGKPLWSGHVGEGSTSPLLVGDRLYSMGHFNKTDYVLCLDASTGKEVWKFSYPARKYGRHAV